MKTKGVIEGMQIISKYYNNDGFNVKTEHEIIYMSFTDCCIESSDIKKLIEWGWFQEGITEENEDFKLEDYSIEENWLCFT